MRFPLFVRWCVYGERLNSEAEKSTASRRENDTKQGVSRAQRKTRRANLGAERVIEES